MSRIKAKNTKPELAVRSMLHRMGYRFRLHRKDLPGSPDLVFVSKRKVIFVHGCFWHGHKCKKDKMPKTREEFWREKIDRNRMRDKRNRTDLTRLGWKILIVWECEIRSKIIDEKIIKFLEKN